MFNWVVKYMKPGGLFCIEARSVTDPRYGKGTMDKDDKDAWIDGHYRRFVRMPDLLEDLSKMGLKIDYSNEVDGASVFGKDSANVIRVVAQDYWKNIYV